MSDSPCDRPDCRSVRVLLGTVLSERDDARERVAELEAAVRHVLTLALLTPADEGRLHRLLRGGK